MMKMIKIFITDLHIDMQPRVVRCQENEKCFDDFYIFRLWNFHTPPPPAHISENITMVVAKFWILSANTIPPSPAPDC
jgi:hypothetical protein